MPVDRPTFSESWYRVAELRPRLRAALQTSRQHFRGQCWHVIKDPSNNQFFRLNEPAYHFVALLDGRRTVSEVWRICNEDLGDSAPTQGEAIQLLGQLYTSNLLQAELAPDAEGLLNRYRKRKQREVQGFLTNLLFVKVPLIDPDRFLNRWVGIFGRVFSIPGLIAWMLIVGTGLYFVIANAHRVADRASGILAPDNLVLLYLSFVLIKVIHEFGHAFSCKRFGQLSGGGGEVHTMGVMFLVFMPMPYVDATSVWEFGRNKWHRVIVGAGGILPELAVASIAAVVWAHTAEGTTAHAVAYNVMFLASVSTLLFNGNPLLRFDAYYILSDLIEIPNLWQRSRDYIYFLVRRYVYGFRQARNPAHNRGEKIWFVFYGIASTVYRVFISVRILLFVANQIFFVGAILAVAAGVAWVLVPLYKFVRYLATSNELSRVRGRAVGITAAVAGSLVVLIALIPMPDRYRLEGIVQPRQQWVVATTVGGTLRQYRPDGPVAAGEWLLRTDDVDLVQDHQRKLKELDALRIRLEAAKEAVAAGQMDAAYDIAPLTRMIAAGEDALRFMEERLGQLTVTSQLAGVWISPGIDRYVNAYLKPGEQVGLVASNELIIRLIGQQDFPVDQVRVGQEVELRVKGRADLSFRGVVTEKLPAGQTRLPSPSLGYAAGGSVRTAEGRSAQRQDGMDAAERFFEIHVAPILDEHGRVAHSSDPDQIVRLMAHQRVVARFSAPERPLGAQWYHSLQQLVQQHFR